MTQAIDRFWQENIAKLHVEMGDEIRVVLREVFDDGGDVDVDVDVDVRREWRRYVLYDALHEIIFPTISRVAVGLPLSRE